MWTVLGPKGQTSAKVERQGKIGFDLLNLLFNLRDELAFSAGPGCVG